MRLALFGDTDESALPAGWTKETIVVGAGDVHLDLSRRPPGPDASLTVFRLFGDVRIAVPPGASVALSGATLFGDQRARVEGEGTGGPSLRVKVLGIAGDVVVEGRPAGT